MVASCVDVKVCLSTPLSGIQLWVNVLSDIIMSVNVSPWCTTQLSTIRFVFFYTETDVTSEVLTSLMSSCVCQSETISKQYLKGQFVRYSHMF